MAVVTELIRSEANGAVSFGDYTLTEKKKLEDSDFEKAFETCGIPAKVFSNLKKKYIKLYPAFCDFIDSSFLDYQMKADYQTLLAERLQPKV